MGKTLFFYSFFLWGNLATQGFSHTLSSHDPSSLHHYTAAESVASSTIAQPAVTTESQPQQRKNHITHKGHFFSVNKTFKWLMAGACMWLLPGGNVSASTIKLLPKGLWIPPANIPLYNEALQACEAEHCEIIKAAITNQSADLCSEVEYFEFSCVRTCKDTIAIDNQNKALIIRSWITKSRCEKNAIASHAFYDAKIECPEKEDSQAFPYDRINANRCFDSKFCKRYGQQLCMQDDNLPWHYQLMFSNCEENICPGQFVEKRFTDEADTIKAECIQDYCDRESLDSPTL